MFLNKPYHREHIVTEADLDELNHVNNVQYVHWVQDMARDHWQAAIADRFPTNKYAWVLAKHSIAYKRPAFLGDRLRFTTYISGFGTASSTRIVEISHAESDKLCVRSETVWCLFDLERQRPMAIPAEVKALAE